MSLSAFMQSVLSSEKPLSTDQTAFPPDSENTLAPRDLYFRGLTSKVLSEDSAIELDSELSPFSRKNAPENLKWLQQQVSRDQIEERNCRNNDHLEVETSDESLFQTANKSQWGVSHQFIVPSDNSWAKGKETSDEGKDSKRDQLDLVQDVGCTPFAIAKHAHCELFSDVNMPCSLLKFIHPPRNCQSSNVQTAIQNFAENYECNEVHQYCVPSSPKQVENFEQEENPKASPSQSQTRRENINTVSGSCDEMHIEDNAAISSKHAQTCLSAIEDGQPSLILKEGSSKDSRVFKKALDITSLTSGNLTWIQEAIQNSAILNSRLALLIDGFNGRSADSLCAPSHESHLNEMQAGEIIPSLVVPACTTVTKCADEMKALERKWIEFFHKSRKPTKLVVDSFI
jgi:hypothetical protein